MRTATHHGLFVSGAAGYEKPGGWYSARRVADGTCFRHCPIS